MANKFDDLVRAVTENDTFGRKIQFLRERRTQIKTAAIGIKIRPPSRASCIATSACGDGPSGFSFEASLTIWSTRRPESRAVSSIGLPGS